MRKQFPLLMSLAMLFSLVGCGEKKEEHQPVTGNDVVVRDDEMEKIAFSKIYGSNEIRSIVNRIQDAIAAVNSTTYSTYSYAFMNNAEVEITTNGNAYFEQSYNSYLHATVSETARKTMNSGGVMTYDITSSSNSEYRCADGNIYVSTNSDGLLGQNTHSETTYNYSNNYALAYLVSSASFPNLGGLASYTVGETAKGELCAIFYNEANESTPATNKNGETVKGHNFNYNYSLLRLNTYNDPKLLSTKSIAIWKTDVGEDGVLQDHFHTIGKESSNSTINYGSNGQGGYYPEEPTTTPPGTNVQTSTRTTTPFSSATSQSRASSASVERPYISLPFNSFEGSNYSEESINKWTKGFTYKWTFWTSRAEEGITVAIGAQLTGSFNYDRSLYTDHNGILSDIDPFEANEANDGTPRIELANNGVNYEITHVSYDEAGLTATELNYYEIGNINVVKGKNVITITTHAQAGYRLMFGGEIRLLYQAGEPSLQG